MRKRPLAILVLCALILPILCLPIKSAPEAFSVQSLSARAAILIDADDKTVLAEKCASERMGEASTTKIMTALVVAESMPLDKIVAVPREAVGTEGSSVYLCEGELLTVGDLLYALLLASANDAATALAILCAGSIEAFAEKMNRRADSLGLCNTHFTNPHGLYDEDHYTTAYDLALISAEALRNESLRTVFATRKATVPLGVTESNPEGEGKRYLQNHNKMLALYDGAIGVKTGFTKKTGRCLVSAAKRDGMTLIAVTLDAPDDWRDHSALLDYGFSSYERATVFDVGQFSYPYSVAGGNEAQVMAINSLPITLTLPKIRENADTRVEFPQRFEIAPVCEGDILGELTVSINGKAACSPLVAAYSVEATTKKKHKFFWQS
ncbi:MAG: D-alanyl-D-alanine carboxypeptidase [Clostridia bacterium]|nr:D-alanyl-D-alanine carboxypeptidase [Clostridia bacterium]